MIGYHSTGHMALTFRKTVRVIVTKTSAWFFISFLRQTTLRDHTRVASFTKTVIKEESNGKVKFSFVEGHHWLYFRRCVESLDVLWSCDKH